MFKIFLRYFKALLPTILVFIGWRLMVAHVYTANHTSIDVFYAFFLIPFFLFIAVIYTVFSIIQLRHQASGVDNSIKLKDLL
jgi:ATP/ADP translocase